MPIIITILSLICNMGPINGKTKTQSIGHVSNESDPWVPHRKLFFFNSQIRDSPPHQFLSHTQKHNLSLKRSLSLSLCLSEKRLFDIKINNGIYQLPSPAVTIEGPISHCVLFLSTVVRRCRRWRRAQQS